MTLKISFDIGGVLSKYPDVFRPMVKALKAGGAEVFVITDMPDHAQSVRYVQENGYDIPGDHILNADYPAHGEDCKAVLIELHGIDLHIDDFPSYCAHTSAVSLFVWPNPERPYYHETFKTDGSEGSFGRCKKSRMGQSVSLSPWRTALSGDSAGNEQRVDPQNLVIADVWFDAVRGEWFAQTPSGVLRALTKDLVKAGADGVLKAFGWTLED